MQLLNLCRHQQDVQFHLGERATEQRSTGSESRETASALRSKMAELSAAIADLKAQYRDDERSSSVCVLGDLVWRVRFLSRRLTLSPFVFADPLLSCGAVKTNSVL